MANNAGKITELVAPFLEPGERVLAATPASPRGRQTAAVGGAAGLVGAKLTGNQSRAAAGAGVVIESHMAVVLTDARLLTLKVKLSAAGAVTEVKHLLSAVPLSAISSMEAKRFGLGGVLTITAASGDTFKLELRVGPARELADAFAAAT